MGSRIEIFTLPLATKRRLINDEERKRVLLDPSFPLKGDASPLHMVLKSLSQLNGDGMDTPFSLIVLTVWKRASA